MKILFTGLGSIGQRHLRNLRTLLGDEFEPMAWRARRKDVVLDDKMQVQAGRTIAEHYGVREFDDYAAALDQRPDAVFITNPTAMHVPAALEAARAGCNLFIEKPLSDSDEGLDELIETVSENRLVAMVGCQQRFHAGLIRCKQWLDSGRLGNLISARFENGEYMPYWHKYEDYRETYGAKKSLGGGTLLTQIHELDYVVWMLGMPQTVFAAGGHLSELEVEVNDTADVMMSFPAASGSIPVSVHLDYLQWPAIKRGLLIGDRGRIEWDYMANRAEAIDRATETREVWHEPDYPRNEMFLSELKHFVACLRGTGQLQIPLIDGRNALRIALAARQSIDEGKAVDL